jgi:hypothetical protein
MFVKIPVLNKMQYEIKCNLRSAANYIHVPVLCQSGFALQRSA